MFGKIMNIKTTFIVRKSFADWNVFILVRSKFLFFTVPEGFSLKLKQLTVPAAFLKTVGVCSH